ncbi:hypothetical protein ACQ4XT_08520 [Halobacillus faecis]
MGIETSIINLVSNGDFSGGTGGWRSIAAAITSSSSNELSFVASNNRGRVFQTIDFPDGHLIYRSAQVKSTSNLVALGRTFDPLKYHTGSGSYERLSHVDSQSNLKYVSVFDNRNGGWDTVFVKNVIAIDLTASFGSGNEPSAEAMDSLLLTLFENGWFDGEKNLSSTNKDDIEDLDTRITANTNSKWEVVNIKEQFGAVSDGPDNSQPFQDAIDYARTNNLPLYLPQGDYNLAESINIDGITRIVFEGTVNMDSGKVLEISYNSNFAPVDWRFTNIRGGKLRLVGLNSSKIEVLKADELELYAYGDIPGKDFIAYNTFILGKIDTFTMDSQGNADGWINENKFYGGRFQLLSINGNYNHNNNIFYGTMLENFTLNLVNGSSNYFYDVRMEGTNSITFGSGSSNNVLYKSYFDSPFEYLRDTTSIEYTDFGINNHVISNIDTFFRKELIYHLNHYSANYQLETLTRNESDLTIKASNVPLFETDFIELRRPISFITKSNQDLFEIYLYAYDEDKNIILEEQTNFTSLAGGLFNTSTGAYSFGANVGTKFTGVPAVPNGVVKYIKYQVNTGNGTTGDSFEFLKVEKCESIRDHTIIDTVNKHKRWSSLTMPSEGYWRDGDIVWNTGGDQTVAFWRRASNGSSHVLNIDWIAH